MMEGSQGTSSEREKSFVIFHFLIDNSAEVVPESWLSPCKAFCWYPHAGSKTKVSKAVKAAASITEDFTKYAGRVLGVFGKFILVSFIQLMVKLVIFLASFVNCLLYRFL